jgi:hypothetical protein
MQVGVRQTTQRPKGTTEAACEWGREDGPGGSATPPLLPPLPTHLYTGHSNTGTVSAPAPARPLARVAVDAADTNNTGRGVNSRLGSDSTKDLYGEGEGQGKRGGGGHTTHV